MIVPCVPFTSTSAPSGIFRVASVTLTTQGIPSSRDTITAWLSGAPKRIGYEVAGRSWMYTHRVDRPRELRARHSVENPNRDPAAGPTLPPPHWSVPRMRI